MAKKDDTLVRRADPVVALAENEDEDEADAKKTAEAWSEDDFTGGDGSAAPEEGSLEVDESLDIEDGFDDSDDL